MSVQNKERKGKMGKGGKGFVFTAASFATAAILLVSATYLLNARQTIESGRAAALRIASVQNAFNDFAGIAALHKSNIFADTIAEAAKSGSCNEAAGAGTAISSRLASAANEFIAITGVSATPSNVQLTPITSSATQSGCSIRLRLSFSLSIFAFNASQSGIVASTKTVSVSSGNVAVADDFLQRTDYP